MQTIKKLDLSRELRPLCATIAEGSVLQLCQKIRQIKELSL